MSCQQHPSHYLNKAPAEGVLEKARQEMIQIKALNGEIYSLDTSTRHRWLFLFWKTRIQLCYSLLVKGNKCRKNRMKEKKKKDY